jgi:hypothetical protein
MSDFDKLEYLNTCGECNNAVILGNCHICNNNKKYRKDRFYVQLALEKLFNYKLAVYINQELLPEYSSLEFDFVIKKIDKTGILKHCILIDTTANKSDLTIRKIYNTFNLSIKHNFTFYYLLIDKCKPNIISNFLMNCYPKIPANIKVKNYMFCKNTIVNKSKVSINKLKQVIDIYNTRLSLSTKLKKENHHILLLRKYNEYINKHKKHEIRTLKDLNGLSALPEYDDIYDAIETLIIILKKNSYDVPYISNLLFEENTFTILEMPHINRLNIIKYNIKKGILSNFI